MFKEWIQRLKKIFLTDISRIGKKIMLSYLVVILVTTVAFIVVSKISFNDLLGRQAQEDLKKDADMITEQIETAIDYQRNHSMEEHAAYENTIVVEMKDCPNSNSPGLVSIRIPKHQMPFHNRFSTTYTIVLDKQKSPIYVSRKEGSEIDLEHLDRSQYFVEERMLSLSSDLEPIGYVMMLSPKGDLDIIDGLINSSVLWGVLVSMIISLMLAFFLEQTIIRPITKLRINMSKFSLDEEYTQWEEIESRDEISDMSEDFLKLINKLRAYDKRQKEFFQNTSHELKTPLMSIQGYAEAIKDGVLEEEFIYEGLDIIIDESKRLRDTLNSMVYLGKVSAAEKNDIRDIQLWELIEELKYKLSGISHEKSVRIVNQIDMNWNIHTSDEKMDRIFSNIISNAIRYARSEVRIESGQMANGQRMISVEDDGRGFEKGEEELVFDRFYKGKGGNTGLGLAIVRSIVDSNGWTVRASKAKLGGARIEILFPPGVVLESISRQEKEKIKEHS